MPHTKEWYEQHREEWNQYMRNYRKFRKEERGFYIAMLEFENYLLRRELKVKQNG